MGGWRLHACVVLSACACACTTSGSVTGGSYDASVDATASADASPGMDSATVADGTTPSEDTGAPTDAGADAPVDAALACPAWDGSYESPACAECLRDKCCGAVTTCESDPDCVALDDCVNACISSGGDEGDAGDAGEDGGSISTCAQNCADTRTPTVRSEWQALSNCLEFDCYNKGAGPCL